MQTNQKESKANKWLLLMSFKLGDMWDLDGSW